VCDQQLKPAGDESQRCQRGRNLLSGVVEVADQVEEGVTSIISNPSMCLCGAEESGWSFELLARSCSATERAEDHAHKRGGKHDGGDPDDACPHRRFSLLRLVGTTTRCRINDRALHEGEHSYRD
jgi:hypothetical protein